MASLPPESQPGAHAGEPPPAECPPDRDLPENAPEHLDAQLDHAIEETFPTSDPVSVSITKGGAIDYDHQGAADRPGGHAREPLRDIAASAAGAAHAVLERGQRFVRHAGARDPEVGRAYREGRQAVRQRVSENPWPALVVAAASGYALGWLIHGRREPQERVPDDARAGRGYVPHRAGQGRS